LGVGEDWNSNIFFFRYVEIAMSITMIDYILDIFNSFQIPIR